MTGEALRRACEELKQDLEGRELKDLNGREYKGEYLADADPMGSPKKHPVSHVAYGYATQVVLLNEDGTIEKVVAAHDVGKAINPLSVEGQIEGGVVMSLGYALTEEFPLDQGRPTAKFGTLGLFRADKTPEVESIIIEKNKDSLAYGAVIGEITSIPTAPAVQGAYYQYDRLFRTALPLEQTAYGEKETPGRKTSDIKRRKDGMRTLLQGGNVVFRHRLDHRGHSDRRWKDSGFGNGSW